MIHNWNKIVENAISTTVALIVVSAGAIVWKAAMSVDQKIDDAIDGVNLQGEALHKAIDVIEKELADLRADQRVFEDVEEESDQGYEQGYIQQQLPADYNIPRGMKK